MTATANSDRIPTLDGLRAVAILIVMITHLFHASLAPLGHMGVLIFFALFLSGAMKVVMRPAYLVAGMWCQAVWRLTAG